MSSRYGQVERVLCRQGWFRRSSPEARLVYLMLRVGSDGTSLPGLVETDACRLVSDTGLPLDRVRAALDELAAAGAVEVDEEHCLIADRSTPPAPSSQRSHKTLSGWWAIWQELPRCVLALSTVATLKEYCDLSQPDMQRTWDGTFGTLNEGASHAPSQGPSDAPLDPPSDGASDAPPEGPSMGVSMPRAGARAGDSVQRSAISEETDTHTPGARDPAEPRVEYDEPARVVSARLDRRTLEDRWRVRSGVNGFSFPGVVELAAHVEAAAAQSGMDPAELFDRAVDEFKAYRATCTTTHVPQLVPRKLVEHWATVWERITGTRPAGAAARISPKRARGPGRAAVATWEGVPGGEER